VPIIYSLVTRESVEYAKAQDSIDKPNDDTKVSHRNYDEETVK
jgi:hypothetical protein